MADTGRREEIEYVVGGGAAYSTSHDYAVILQHLLAHYVAIHSDTPRPANPILSDKSVESLFNPTLPESAKEAVAECVTHVLGEAIAPGEADWTTATAIYTPHDGRRRPCLGMPGRHAGSIGWGGAAGTLYWIDLKAGIAVSHPQARRGGYGPSRGSGDMDPPATAIRKHGGPPNTDGLHRWQCRRRCCQGRDLQLSHSRTLWRRLSMLHWKEVGDCKHIIELHTCIILDTNG